MDLSEAARMLGVADSEVREVRVAGGRFEVLHHDMASHEETWRPVPGGPEPADDAVEPEDAGEPESKPEAKKPAPKRRPSR